LPIGKDYLSVVHNFAPFKIEGEMFTKNPHLLAFIVPKHLYFPSLFAIMWMKVVKSGNKWNAGSLSGVWRKKKR
jgi:hypothetical protein